MWYRKKLKVSESLTIPEVNPVLKYTLFTFSVLYWLFGLGLILVGVYACAEKGIIIDDFSNLITDPAIVILTLGCGLFSLTFFACVGALRENICMLQFFSIVLAVSLFLQFVAGFITMVLSDHVEGIVRNYLMLMIEKYREDVDRQDIVDWGQEEFKCCGADSYRDWEKNMYFNCDETNPGYERCSVPWTCCKATDAEAVRNTLCGIGVLELSGDDVGDAVYINGCIPTMVFWIHSHIFVLACLAVGLAIPQIVGVCISRMLLLQIKDHEYYYSRVNQIGPDETAVDSSV